MNRSTPWLVLFALLGAGTLVLAQSPAGASTAPAAPPVRVPPAERFKQIDANHDGKVTLEEFRVAREKEIKEATKAGTGGATPNGKPEVSPEDTFRRIDTNGDGYITQDEFVKYFDAMFRARPSVAVTPK